MLIVQLADINKISLDLSLLPKQILDDAKVLSPFRQKQFLASRCLLAKLLNHYFDNKIQTLPAIHRTINNRPSFIDSALPDFNISHSQNLIAVGLSLTNELGIDIEVVRDNRNYLKIAKQFFSSKEYNWIIDHANPLAAFWQLWTLKESALKLYAKGVWQIKSVEIDIQNQIITSDFAENFYYHYKQIGTLHVAINSNKPIDNLVILTE